MSQIISQPVSVSAKETYSASFSVAVDEFVSNPSPSPGPIGYFDFRITYDWQWRAPGVPGWQSANRTVTKNTSIPSTWGGSTRNSVFNDTFAVKATQARNNKLYRCVITYRIRNLGAINNISIRTLTSTSAALTVTLRPHLFNLSSFNIIPDVPYRNALTSAANRWNNLVKYPQYHLDAFPSYSGVSLTNYTAIHSTGLTIATCGPLDVFNYGQPSEQPIYPGYPTFSSQFNLDVNTRYFVGSGTNMTANDWINVLTHELGHAIGIGTFTQQYVASGYVVPTPSGNANFGTLRRLSNNEYPETVKQYNAVAQNIPLLPLRTAVPLENVGELERLGHWQNNYVPPSSINVAAGVVAIRPSFNGIVNELMVAAYTPGNPNKNFISQLSIGQLKDFRYEEVSPGARESGTLIIDSGNIVQNQSLSDTHFCGTCRNI
jgi:hypothetical protein